MYLLLLQLYTSINHPDVRLGSWAREATPVPLAVLATTPNAEEGYNYAYTYVVKAICTLVKPFQSSFRFISLQRKRKFL